MDINDVVHGYVKRNIIISMLDGYYFNIEVTVKVNSRRYGQIAENEYIIKKLIFNHFQEKITGSTYDIQKVDSRKYKTHIDNVIKYHPICFHLIDGINIVKCGSYVSYDDNKILTMVIDSDRYENNAKSYIRRNQYYELKQEIKFFDDINCEQHIELDTGEHFAKSYFRKNQYNELKKDIKMNVKKDIKMNVKKDIKIVDEHFEMNMKALFNM